ncbi:PD40 domain-containing protein [candidate division KSB1 bacterium]|nr:PD40 domain-containing protein [candidate division KSB1 bacterium]
MRRLTFALLLLAVIGRLPAQDFGQNKVQFEYFKWRYIQSEHFDVYFSPGGERLAEFTAETAEHSLKQIEQHWNYDLETRVTIVIYRSHNNFQQTNVSSGIPEESVGGFTEFFKNRVVLPFTGNWESFRHVIHHELTHAVNLRMFYGSGFQSILIGTATSNIPLWFTEGLAEYESRSGWDVEADMFMRDATISGYLPNVDDLYGYFAYKGGQSVFYYLDRKYGSEKVGEFVNKVKNTRDVERSIKSAVGMDMEEFNRSWQSWLRKIYWPTVTDLKPPTDFSERMTDHEKWRNFVNNGGAISPDGSTLAFLSDRSDYFDLWLLEIESGKQDRVLQGERSGNFEQLKWLDARISWSPDGERITFASKSGRIDAVNILDVKRGRVTEQLRFDMDAIFNPTWSRDGQRIAFVGIKSGQSDLYVYELAQRQLRQVTDDPYSDDDPAWSTDSESLYFTSDRGDSLRVRGYSAESAMWTADYRQTDIYLVRVGEMDAQRMTRTPTNERTPTLTPNGQYLMYSSDASGIYNLYRYDLESGAAEAVTNCLTGCLQPSYSLNTQRMTFASFYEGGYDVYLVKNAEELPALSLSSTNLRLHGSPEPLPSSAEQSGAADRASIEIGDTQRPYGQYIFANTGGVENGEPVATAYADTATTRKAGGGFFSKKYRTRFTPDFVYATAAYSSFFGAQGRGQILFSDVLGNQLIYVNTDLYYDFNNLDNSNFSVQYLYLPRRVNYGLGLYRYVYYLDAGDIRDQTWQLGMDFQYPLSKYTRTELNLQGFAIDRARWDGYDQRYRQTSRRRVFQPELAYVHDTVVWGSTGPVNGTRYRLSLGYSPDLDSSPSPNDKWSSQFLTMKADARDYIRLGRDYSWASRLTAGFSEGDEPQRFFLGGVSNWINRRFENDSIPTENIDDFYFSNFVTPFRGGDYFEQRGTGTRFFLTNQEFRFPMVRYLQLGWPLPIGIRDIRGALFTDIGAAWYGDQFHFTKKDEFGRRRLEDVQTAYGLGMRSWLGFFILRWDVAWNTDGVDTSKPLYYMSIGAEY